uniref:NADH:flavin oxidoreductase/NADH oxidase N-terminal domain-containing protein n=1 Tax=Acrobeloides nanus TaxID=290746 RepID=A0A914CWW6_9BILA
MSKRIVVSTIDDPSILAEVLQFQTSKKVVKNRFLKAALTERTSSYDRNKPEKCGIPTERLVNLYTKWGHGGFGLICTGNIVVDYKHLESAGNAIIDQRIESTEHRNAFRKIANAIKSDGSVAIAQLSNAGRQTPITINEHPFSASDVQLKVMRRGAGSIKQCRTTNSDHNQ